MLYSINISQIIVLVLTQKPYNMIVIGKADK